MKILVVEDHIKIRENIIDFLKIKWHTAEGVMNGKMALESLHNQYDIIVLDMNMPEMNGGEFLFQLRERGFSVPVLVLTSNNLIDDKAEMFALGADDYLIKPFDMRELEMRILSLGRRRERAIETEISFADCKICLEKRIVLKAGEKVDLTSKEYAILEFLARHKGFPKTKTDILEAVWGMRESELNADSITLEVHISSIRKKLWKNIIETVKGTGYILE